MPCITVVGGFSPDRWVLLGASRRDELAEKAGHPVWPTQCTGRMENPSGNPSSLRSVGVSGDIVDSQREPGPSCGNSLDQELHHRCQSSQATSQLDTVLADLIRVRVAEANEPKDQRAMLL